MRQTSFKRFARQRVCAHWWRLGLLTALVWPALVGPAGPSRGEVPAPSSGHALILYDGPATSGDGLVMARQVGNLMGHFNFGAELKPMSAYTAGLADRFDALFVCGMTQGAVVPAALLADVAQRNKTTVWLRLHVDQLTARTNVATRLGFTFVGEDDEGVLDLVMYRGIKIPNSDYPDLDRVRILDPRKVQVLATATDADRTETVPYVLRSGRFWYFAGPGSAFGIESDVSLVFADLLHDILEVYHPTERRALVRIEDVSAASDPADLRRVADLLAARHVPFAIALIPFYRDPINHVDLDLSEEPDVIQALHYMVAHGGSIVMHGITHQLHGVSGDDYEFWDTLFKRPTPDGAPGRLLPKLQRGLEECFRAGIYPLTFETPHYSASQEHYRSLAMVFSHLYDRVQLCDEAQTEQYFPFPTTDLFGTVIIPENLGYVHAEHPEADTILQAARRLEVVRDPVASFFFHPFMPSGYLEQILTGLEREGYRFISIKEFGPTVRLGDAVVTARDQTVTVTPRQAFLKITTVGANGQATDRVRAVQPRQPLTLTLAPPPGGLVAVQSIARAPLPPPAFGWWSRLRRALGGAGLDGLPATAVRAREAWTVGASPPFESALGAYGIPCHRFNPALPIPPDAFVVVPQGAAMNTTTQERLAAWIERGGRAVLEGHTSLAERLGFEFENRFSTAQSLQDTLVPDVPIHWSHPVTVERFRPPPLSSTLVQESTTELPVAVAVRVGDGRVIYLAADLDPETGLGYTRYPFLVLHLRQRFGLEPPVTASGAEFYFDPGFREQMPVETLVKSWHDQGVQVVYAAAWHFYPRWAYDYDRLIRLCHAQGIAVYAWLELPEVSPKFWEAHPQWREQTVTGRDAQIGWRQFMNLADPACRAAALRFVDRLLAGHDWDGVNIAELCFDTEDGLAKPDGYIPMNPLVCRQFQQQAGFDPHRLFDPASPDFWKRNGQALARWTRFRTGLTRAWLAEVLAHVTRHPLDVLVTALDSLGTPRVIEKNGCDSRDVISLMDRYPFTLQVEDSEELWGAPPTRYTQLGALYRKLVTDPARLMFDINVVKDRDPSQAPTAQPVGVELALAVHAAAAAGNGRVAIYSESTVLPQDLAMLPFVLGSGTQIIPGRTGTTIVARRPVRLHFAPPHSPTHWWTLPSRDSLSSKWPAPVVDGRAWYLGTPGSLLLGAGTHHLTGGTATAKPRAWIRGFTAVFTAVTPTALGFQLRYSSPRRAWLTISQRPSAVWCDGRPLTGAVTPAAGTDWLVKVPAGDHHLEVEEAATATMAVEEAGAEALASITWLGARAVLFLAALYLLTRARRCASRFARQKATRL